jgi:hypothetical protein
LLLDKVVELVAVAKVVVVIEVVLEDQVLLLVVALVLAYIHLVVVVGGELLVELLDKLRVVLVVKQLI